MVPFSQSNLSPTPYTSVTRSSLDKHEIDRYQVFSFTREPSRGSEAPLTGSLPPALRYSDGAIAEHAPVTKPAEPTSQLLSDISRGEYAVPLPETTSKDVLEGLRSFNVVLPDQVAVMVATYPSGLAPMQRFVAEVHRHEDMACSDDDLKASRKPLDCFQAFQSLGIEMPHTLAAMVVDGPTGLSPMERLYFESQESEETLQFHNHTAYKKGQSSGSHATAGSSIGMACRTK